MANATSATHSASFRFFDPSKSRGLQSTSRRSSMQSIKSYGPFSPPDPANVPSRIRPGSPTTIMIRREPRNNSRPPYSTSERERIREGKKREVPMVRRRTVGGDEAARQPKLRLPSMPFLRRAKTCSVGSMDCGKNRRSNITDDREREHPLLLDTDQGGDQKTSRQSSSGSVQTERRFGMFKHVRKLSRSVPRPRVQRSRSRPTKTSVNGRDSNACSGALPADIGLSVFSRDVDPFSDPFSDPSSSRISSGEITPPGTGSGGSSSSPDHSPRTSFSCPQTMAQIQKEQKPQWLPLGSAMRAWISEPRSSTWLEDLESELERSQKDIELLPHLTQSVLAELKQQRPLREPGREVCFAERLSGQFDPRDWDEKQDDAGENKEDGESSVVAEESETGERVGMLRQRMDSARASISKGLQRLLVGRKKSSPSSG